MKVDYQKAGPDESGKARYLADFVCVSAETDEEDAFLSKLSENCKTSLGSWCRIRLGGGRVEGKQNGLTLHIIGFNESVEG